ncbi:MAG TPA: TRAP transporter substrate-binding protein [Thiolinea sp.]|nr:TRAP transporter substrate-binding protein [Thiolinea sp.]
MKRREFLTGSAAAGLGATVMLSPVLAEDKASLNWRLPTAFPKAAPGVGTNITAFAEKVAAMSDGRLSFEVFGAGELVPPFGVEDAVQAGNVPVGHGPTYYSAGKNPALHWFTGVPFGMTSNEHAAWLIWGGGQKIWDAIYAERQLKPLYCGSSNVQAGGWFKRPVEKLDDLKGLNMRIAGLGGEVMRKLGVNAVLTPPPEIFQALQSGAIDAAEWVGPMLDQAFGLQKICKICYLSGFLEPGAGLAVVFNQEKWDELPKDLQAICEGAALAMSTETCAQFDYFNTQALERLTAEGVEFLPFPDEVIKAQHAAWEEVKAGLVKDNEDVARVVASYDAYLAQARNYDARMTAPVLAGRG